MKMQNLAGQKQQGFTIIELVVVILLLGILAATALPRFIDVTEQAHDAVFSGVSGSFVTGTALYRAEWVARGQPATNTAIQSYGGLQVAPGFSITSNAYTAAGEGGPPSVFDDANAFQGRASGYPWGLDHSTIVAANLTSAQCANVFENLLQIGAPTASAVTGVLLTDFANASDADEIRDAVSAAQADTSADYQVFVRTISVDTGFAANNSSDPVVPTNAADEARNHQLDAPACVYAYSAEAENFNRFLLYVPWNGRTEIFRTAASLFDALDAFDGPAVTQL